MTAQLQNILKKIGLNQKDDLILIGEGFDRNLPKYTLGKVRSLKEIIPVFEMFQTGWIKQVEPLGTEGIRVYIETELSQEREQTIQQLHAMLEQVTDTSIDRYWDNGYIEFVQNNGDTKDELDSSVVDNGFDLGLPENFLVELLSLKEVIAVFSIFQTGWVKQIEPLDMIGIQYFNTNGIRFYLETEPSQEREQIIQKLREMLEWTVNAPINIY